MYLSERYGTLEPATLKLDGLLLDPNNPRFSLKRPEEVAWERYRDEDIQIQCRDWLGEWGLADLVESIKANGYVDIDRIVVWPWNDKKYVVLEGNRRVAACKSILEQARLNPDSVPKEIIEAVSELSVLVYKGDDTSISWQIQSLRHLGAPKDWPAYAKARYAYMRRQQGKTFSQIGAEAGGVSPQRVAVWYKAYSALRQAQDHEEVGTYVKKEHFPFFNELFGRMAKPLRDWMEWNKETSAFENEEHFADFIQLLLPDDGAEPKLTASYDVNRLGKLRRKSEEAFSDFLDGTLNLDQAHAKAIRIAAEAEPEEEKDIEYYTERIQSNLDALAALFEEIELMTSARGKESLLSVLDDAEQNIRHFKEIVRALPLQD